MRSSRSDAARATPPTAASHSSTKSRIILKQPHTEQGLEDQRLLVNQSRRLKLPSRVSATTSSSSQQRPSGGSSKTTNRATSASSRSNPSAVRNGVGFNIPIPGYMNWLNGGDGTANQDNARTFLKRNCATFGDRPFGGPFGVRPGGKVLIKEEREKKWQGRNRSAPASATNGQAKEAMRSTLRLQSTETGGALMQEGLQPRRMQQNRHQPQLRSISQQQQNLSSNIVQGMRDWKVQERTSKDDYDSDERFAEDSESDMD
eukprot:jgi/Bigna1/126830/aug1.3_g1538